MDASSKKWDHPQRNPLEYILLRHADLVDSAPSNAEYPPLQVHDEFSASAFFARYHRNVWVLERDVLITLKIPWWCRGMSILSPGNLVINQVSHCFLWSFIHLIGSYWVCKWSTSWLSDLSGYNTATLRTASGLLGSRWQPYDLLNLSISGDLHLYALRFRKHLRSNLWFLVLRLHVSLLYWDYWTHARS